MNERLERGKTIEERQQELALRLRYLVGTTHERLSLGGIMRSIGGGRGPRLLTYGEIMQRNSTGSYGIPGMPGAVRCRDPEVELILAEGHMAEIDRCVSSRVNRAIPLKLAGYDVHELQNVVPQPGTRTKHPAVEGYAWCRGLVVPLADDSLAILLTPWMHPNTKGGSPAPVMYTRGDTDPEVLRTIAAAYAAPPAVPTAEPN